MVRSNQGRAYSKGDTRSDLLAIHPEVVSRQKYIPLMDCSICKKPVTLNQRFVSDFTPRPERKYFISHANCAAISEPLKIKTMSPLRMEALETYQALMAKSAAETTPSAT